MKNLTKIGSALVVALLGLGLVPAADAGSAPSMKFGMDRASIQSQIDLGVKPDYAQFWAGVWNEKSGWAYLGQWADEAADKGATPVIEWWYWGDDITRSCVTNGCWSSLHDAQKSRTKWREDAIKLADTLHANLQGRAGIVVLETEFNKGDIQGWETFDGYLAEHARIFRDRAPELKLALGVGNWNSDGWATWDRAAAAMDMVGFQTMRGSTKDSLTTYLGAVDAIKSAAAKLKATFGKPVLLHDFTISSYGSGYEGHQETVIKDVFSRLGELKAAGVSGIIYRSMKDAPDMDLANYYGWAERYTGLTRADGSPTPALNDWVNGVKAERGTTSTPPPPPPSGTFDATFTPKAIGNDWWVEVSVTANEAVAKVEAKVNGGAWQPLTKQSWGTWAKSINAPNGARVEFRAANSAGAWDASAATTWT